MHNRKRLLPFATGLLLGVAFFLLYQRPVYVEFSGSTMGTRYQIKISDFPRDLNQMTVEADIFSALNRVDQLMSTYQPDSDISRFNRSPLGESVQIDRLTLNVVQKSRVMYQQTLGAFDITVGPLVKLWGFGPDIKDDSPPDSVEIQNTLNKIGFDKVLSDEIAPSLSKSSEVEIDLSAIAKGYGVDQVAELLEQYMINDFLIEVGGEIRVKGNNRSGERWRIGVETPSLGVTGAQKTIAIDNASVATSGDYRNFFEYGGKRYSHTISPTTGKPVEHDLASVTVITKSCADADAYATAFNVLGPEKGYKLAEEMKLAAYFIVRENGEFKERMTTSFLRLSKNQLILE